MPRRDPTRRELLRGVIGWLAATPFAPTVAALASGNISGPDDGRQFRGTVVRTSDAHYEEWRRGMVWQMHVPDRKPGLIVRPADVADLRNALKHAQDHSLEIAVKSGGHNVSGAFLRQGGMLVDLADFRNVDVDEVTGTAWVEPAMWCRDLAQVITPLGWAFPYAHCATVPLGGYLLGGGIGINGDEWGGMACHSVLAAEILLADGTLTRVCANENPDLFWAVRGAGTGFFGIITRFKVQLYPLPKTIRTNVYFFPFQLAPRIAEWLDGNIDKHYTQTETMMMLAHHPAADRNGTGADNKVCIARIAVFCDQLDEARKRLKHWGSDPITEHASMKLEDQPATFESMFMESVDVTRGLGFGHYDVESVWSNAPSKTVSALMNTFVESPSHKTHVVISPRAIRQRLEESAFSRIGRAFIGCYSVWDDAADSDRNFEFTRRILADIKPSSVGGYINETDAFRDPERARSAFSNSAWRRLGKLRSKYDPGGLFANFPGV